MDSLSTLTLPAMPATVTPLVYAIPVTDVDQPRNLAKSVTVE
jgi:glucosamine--fructose-6-phosphate aminotransferase (isomerizing)